jgi:UDP-glucose 4-epimerase
MRITVWGGAGFLGSHVSDRLTSAGHDVVIADIDRSRWIRSNQTAFLGDVRNFEDVMESMIDSEIVFNFSGISDIAEANSDPLGTVEQNIIGTVNILNACVKQEISRYIFASTVYVYSESGGFYKCSKQACEQYIEEYRNRNGIDYTILRFGTLYGPRSTPSNSINSFIRSALQDKVITYDGKADSRREYIHVKDAAQICLEMLDERYSNQHFVLTGNQQLKVKDTIRMIGEILRKDELKAIYNQDANSFHYEFTPYTYNPTTGKKYTLPVHIDFGQGILELIEEVKKELHQL